MQAWQKEPTSPYSIPPVYSVSTVRSCPTPEREAYPHPIRTSHTLPNYTTGSEARQNVRKVRPLFLCRAWFKNLSGVLK